VEILPGFPQNWPMGCLMALGGRMKRTDDRPHLGLWLALLILASLVVGGAATADDAAGKSQGSGGSNLRPRLDPNFRSTSHKVVLITDEGINPEQVGLQQNQLVAWISYSRFPSTIVFDREVARDMICHSMVNFSIDQDELRSESIDPGEFASFCELRPGTYPYQVIRASQSESGKKTKPLPNLKGEIIVSKSE
jgi:hypothetical protein